MATNELAAILARRRAKAGGENEPATPTVKPSVSPGLETASPAAKSSVAERIARLKQQSAVASATVDAARAPGYNHSVTVPDTSELVPASSRSVGSSSNARVTSAPSEPVDTSAVAAAQEAAGLRRASNKIQQLQGSLGIHVNSLGRPGGPSSGGPRKPASYQRESIMKTGEEQYGHRQHAMGVAMPGMMGSAIPMPGLAKGGFRLPGRALEGEQRSETSSAVLDDSHATMNRVAGPKRRGPTRPPPGAFRIPTMAVPNIDTGESSQAQVTEPAVVGPPAEILEPKAPEALDEVSPPVPVAASNLFPAPSPAPAPSSAPQYALGPTPTPVPAPTAAATMQKLPEPEFMPPMKPYVLHDDPFTPVYDNPVEQNASAPAGFPSALMANFSMDELVIDDQLKPKPVATSSFATSHVGASSSTAVPISEPHSPPRAPPLESPVPAPAQVVATPAAVHERAPSPIRVSAPAPVAPTPTPVFAPTPAPSAAASVAPTPVVVPPAPAPVSVSAPASEPTPTSSPAPMLGSYLFGAAMSAASDDDDSSESNWSDDDNGSQSLFGAQSTGSTLEAAPTLVTPPQPTSELHPISGSHFGSCAPVPTLATPAPGFVQAAPPAPYSSLFGGAASSSSESDSDSDNEGGLFGSAVPSNR